MLETLLKKQFALHPKMGPADAVKLVYQNELGCGHLLPSENECEQRLLREMAETGVDRQAAAFEPIGNRLCRLSLHAPLVRELGAATIARMMGCTERQTHGSPEKLAEKLALLEALCRKGACPFSPDELAAFLSVWRAEGCPPVSHSQGYREANAPAYRVAHIAYGELLALIGGIHERLQQGRPVLAVLDGYCGAGKSTAAAMLAPLWDASVIRMDDFFLPPSLRSPERLSLPGGNVHFERFESEVLAGLEHGRPFSYHRYDCQTGSSSEAFLTPSRVTLIEGSYALHPRFEAAYQRLDALTALLTVDPEEQRRRILRRNGPEMLVRFEQRWIPLEKKYFEAYDRKRYARYVAASCADD